MSLVISFIALPAVFAHSNEMDMSTDGPMALMTGHMVPYLHFTPGDILWFAGWVPTSVGAMVGACIGLFLLSIVERWIAASRSLMEAHWQKRATLLLKARQRATEKENVDVASIPLIARPRFSTPFIPAHVISRGVIHAGHAALNFAFMLAVMYVLPRTRMMLPNHFAGHFKSRSSSRSVLVSASERCSSGGSITNQENQVIKRPCRILARQGVGLLKLVRGCDEEHAAKPSSNLHSKRPESLFVREVQANKISTYEPLLWSFCFGFTSFLIPWQQPNPEPGRMTPRHPRWVQRAAISAIRKRVIGAEEQCRQVVLPVNS